MLAAEAEYNAGLLDKISVVLGGVPAADLEGAVRELAERAKGTNQPATNDKDHGVKCDPQKCDELRDAHKALLAVQKEFGRAGLAATDAGKPCTISIEGRARAVVDSALELNALVESLRDELARARAARAVVLEVAGVLRGVCTSPEKPGELAGAVISLVAERDGLRMEHNRLLAERDDLLATAKYLRELQPLKEMGDDDQYEVAAGYESLMQVLVAAHNQAANGKGRERHASGEPFERQKICEITRRVGLGYPLGQACKKAIEAQRLGKRGPTELLGAINYLAAAHIVMREQPDISVRFPVAAVGGVAYGEGVGHD